MTDLSYVDWLKGADPYMISMHWKGSQKLRLDLFFVKVILQKLGFQTTLTAFQHLA